VASRATKVVRAANRAASKVGNKGTVVINPARVASKPAPRVDKDKVAVPAWTRAAASKVVSRAVRVAVPVWATKAARVAKAAAAATANRKAIRLDRLSRRIVEQSCSSSPLQRHPFLRPHSFSTPVFPFS
jgi:hypothetical protein